MSSSALAITGLGMISSVGHDVITSCASIRAGISRPGEIDYVQILDSEEYEPQPLLGYPIRCYTEGFNIVGLWNRVAIGCIRDLIEYGNLPGESDMRFWKRTGIIGVTPFINDDRFGDDEDTEPDLIKEVYLHRLHDFLGLPIARENLDVICIGHCGTIAAVKQAEQSIAESHIDRMIVLAVDSYLDPLTIEWLSHRQRLKTPNNAVGLRPGEAGACFILESLESSRDRRANIDALVKGAVVGMERHHYFAEETNQGVALSEVMDETLTRCSAEIPFTGDIISDLNGENWRAREFASARVRLGDRLSSDIRLVLPCECLGDTGAASGAVAVCVAVRSLVRNYATTQNVIVHSSSDYGHVGTMCVLQYEGDSTVQNI